MPSNIVVPEVGESIVDARVAKWLRKEGDLVSAGDPLVELETDKIDLEVAAPQAGVLSRIDRKDGEDVKVGEVLGIVDEAAAGASTPQAARPAEPSRDRPPPMRRPMPLRPMPLRPMPRRPMPRRPRGPHRKRPGRRRPHARLLKNTKSI